MRPLPPIVADMIEKIKTEKSVSARHEYAGRLQDIVAEATKALKAAGYPVKE